MYHVIAVQLQIALRLTVVGAETTGSFFDLSPLMKGKSLSQLSLRHAAACIDNNLELTKSGLTSWCSEHVLNHDLQLQSDASNITQLNHTMTCACMERSIRISLRYLIIFPDNICDESGWRCSKLAAPSWHKSAWSWWSTPVHSEVEESVRLVSMRCTCSPSLRVSTDLKGMTTLNKDNDKLISRGISCLNQRANSMRLDKVSRYALARMPDLIETQGGRLL